MQGSLRRYVRWAMHSVWLIEVTKSVLVPFASGGNSDITQQLRLAISGIIGLVS